MGLHIGEGAVEKLPCALDRKAFHLVRRAAALIIALAGISLGIFVGEDRPLGLKHRLADDVLAGDQFDLVLLALKLMRHARRDRRVGVAEAEGEEAVRLHRVAGCGCAAHGRSLLGLAQDSLDRSEEHTSELQSLMRTSY